MPRARPGQQTHCKLERLRPPSQDEPQASSAPAIRPCCLGRGRPRGSGPQSRGPCSIWPLLGLRVRTSWMCSMGGKGARKAPGPGPGRGFAPVGVGHRGAAPCLAPALPGTHLIKHPGLGVRPLTPSQHGAKGVRHPLGPRAQVGPERGWGLYARAGIGMCCRCACVCGCLHVCARVSARVSACGHVCVWVRVCMCACKHAGAWQRWQSSCQPAATSCQHLGWCRPCNEVSVPGASSAPRIPPPPSSSVTPPPPPSQVQSSPVQAL